jgi:predicted N-acetyltransferase YhbS
VRAAITIDYACDVPLLLPALAAAQATAFASLLAGLDADTTLAQLRTHRQRRALPTTLIAHRDGHWLGGVSLLDNSAADTRPRAPWLASLVVRDERRGLGIGSALIRRGVAEARALGVARLYLYCAAELMGYYATRGWHACGEYTRGAWRAVVMRIDTSGAEPNP